MPALVIVFIVVPLIELYVIIQVGQWIGVWATIALLLIDSILGAALLRSEGRNVWRRFRTALDEGRVPHREVFDGALIIVGGTLLLTPGFVTDIFGLALLIPPSRALIRRFVTWAGLSRFGWGTRAVIWTAGRAADAKGPRGPRPTQQPRRSYDVDGTAHEVPDDPSPGQGPGALPP
jgi:UPF0716 protein FxsA